jgi:hypothetical protein
MRTSISILLLAFALNSCGQGKLPVKKLNVTDGLDYEYVLYPKQDSLRYYVSEEKDTFKVSVHFEKISHGYAMPDIVTTIDDNFFGEEYSQPMGYVPQSYSGDNIINPLGWNFSKDQLFNVAHHNNTLAFLQTDGWIEIKFHGYKIEYYAEKFESYGIAGVSIDKGPETMVDLYAPQEVNNSQSVFVADSLVDSVEHTIRVRYTHQRNPNANSGNARINLDKFVIYQKQPTYYAPKNPAPAKMQYEPDAPKRSN